MFHVLYGCNRDFVLLVTFANEYPCRYRAQGCKLEFWHKFIVVRLPGMQSVGICP